MRKHVAHKPSSTSLIFLGMQTKESAFRLKDKRKRMHFLGIYQYQEANALCLLVPVFQPTVSSATRVLNTLWEAFADSHSTLAYKHIILGHGVKKKKKN